MTIAGPSDIMAIKEVPFSLRVPSDFEPPITWIANHNDDMLGVWPANSSKKNMDLTGTKGIMFGFARGKPGRGQIRIKVRDKNGRVAAGSKNINISLNPKAEKGIFDDVIDIVNGVGDALTAVGESLADPGSGGTGTGGGPWGVRHVPMEVREEDEDDGGSQGGSSGGESSWRSVYEPFLNNRLMCSPGASLDGCRHTERTCTLQGYSVETGYDCGNRSIPRSTSIYIKEERLDVVLLFSTDGRFVAGFLSMHWNGGFTGAYFLPSGEEISKAEFDRINNSRNRAWDRLSDQCRGD